MKLWAYYILMMFPLAGCSDDYSIEGSTTQSVVIDNHKIIKINCYCSNNFEIIEHNEQNLILEITGEESSAGYHGDQNTPSEIQSKILNFKIDKTKESIILSSQEWTYIHHSFLIKKIIVKAPESVEVKWNKIEQNDLEGRGN